MTGVYIYIYIYIDGIHGTPYIAAPAGSIWIRHGPWNPAFFVAFFQAFQHRRPSTWWTTAPVPWRSSPRWSGCWPCRNCKLRRPGDWSIGGVTGNIRIYIYNIYIYILCIYIYYVYWWWLLYIYYISILYIYYISIRYIYYMFYICIYIYIWKITCVYVYIYIYLQCEAP